MKLEDIKNLDDAIQFVRENPDVVRENQLKFNMTDGEIDFVSEIVDETNVVGTAEIIHQFLTAVNGKDLSSIGVSLSVILAVMNRAASAARHHQIDFSDFVNIGIPIYKRKIDENMQKFDETSKVPS